MQKSAFVSAVCFGLFLMPWRAAAQLPADVKANHWAAAAVQQVLTNKVMTLENGKFGGDATVTHTQAVIAVAKLARLLEAGTWKKEPSRAVPGKVISTLEQGTWKQKPVTRYALASVLARMGNYFANGVPRPAPNSNLAKSIVLPAKPTIPPIANKEAAEAVAYLVNGRMLGPKSPVLKPENRPMLGAELSQTIAEMVIGLNDRLTDLGQDEEGNTIDANTKKK
jgi:hypothetical protein